MSIWFREYSLDEINGMARGTIHEPLGIRFTEIGNDYLVATMPVDRRTFQPMGLLHGGASVLLAESLGSIGALMIVNPGQQFPVGLEVNANHIRAVRDGTVTASARPVHLGKTTQVWETRVLDDKGRLVCVSRLTIAILDKTVEFV